MAVRSAKTIDRNGTPIRRRLVGWLAIALTLAPLAGCGKRVVLASLTGRVTFQGQPVTNGVRIVFVNEETGTYIASQLDQAGRYKVDVAEGIGLYPGEYKVAIRLNLPPFSGIPGDPTPPPNRRPDVPSRYHSTTTSGLTVKLDPSGAVFDVDMKP